ncbi:DUF423 domain-containing protein [Spirosoma utsteinense]|uniref:Membrane protein YgdD (TMEM256/DUF423 family) n=1 Tax=Spirosoma utsteinense TaxID=2585773 RepID=A0ABR6WBH3_9BACT|nr:DUF423 domain-containing protein [Spirosoma utsteinense]MBC3784013.1 putative membrane protein YgdD (TMEM256/DUF423 family) [Spirosoma utsteinense]MBC3793498.1 putative membrane protein YgdD (TMEM256/DUF423 family) [Spirosoma utsteinense]
MKFFIQAGAILGLIGVALGAFGAHALKNMLDETGRTATFETAVKYQFYHALALVLVGILLQLFGSNPTIAKLLGWSGNSMLIGTLIFSGSLYVLCFTGITWLGAITPIGGVAMIAGWALLFWAFL